jgi:hypothetical protein
MRSTFIHIKGAHREQIADALSDFSVEGLYLDYYEDHREEYSWQQGEDLRERLGIFPPDVTVMADISGRIVGYQESLRLARYLLTQFDGLVQDDGAGIWSLAELEQDSLSAGGYFMESSRRHARLKVPNGEQAASSNH